MAASMSETHNAGVDDGLLTGWKSFSKSEEEAIESYALGVISKVMDRRRGGGYQRAEDVFVDYKKCNEILIKLLEERQRLTVATFADRYLYYYSKQIKPKMLSVLHTFCKEHMHPTLVKVLGQSREEIKDFLKKEEAEPEDLPWDPEDCIKSLDTNVEWMDDNPQSEINILKEGHFQTCQGLLKEFHRSHAAFQAYIIGLQMSPSEMKKENVQKEIRAETDRHLQILKDSYQDVKNKIPHAKDDAISSGKLAGSCSGTLLTLEEAIEYLSIVYFQVQPEEDDFLKEWSEETNCMNKHALVQKENKRYANRFGRALY